MAAVESPRGFLYIGFISRNFTMQLSPSTLHLLATLDAFSRHTLTRKDDLGVLIELSARQDKQRLFDDLSFLAKFLHKTYALIKRTGKSGDGYDKLVAEFGENLEKATTLARTIVKEAPEEVKRRFSATYFAMTQDSLDNLLALFHDLSWYKNWRIDNPGVSPRPGFIE